MVSSQVVEATMEYVQICSDFSFNSERIFPYNKCYMPSVLSGPGITTEPRTLPEQQGCVTWIPV
jgi:hypothetical protein